MKETNGCHQKEGTDQQRSAKLESILLNYHYGINQQKERYASKKVEDPSIKNEDLPLHIFMLSLANALNN